jgi:sec-independent protein translocase protein TatB
MSRRPAVESPAVFLDPAKLAVILIVALIVLGPDKLPTVARQMGAAWGELRKFRERLETEVRGTFPDLPSSQQVVQAVRSPLSFLDQLADAHEREQKDTQDGQQNGDQPSGAIQATKPLVAGDHEANGTQTPVAQTPVAESPATEPDDAKLSAPDADRTVSAGAPRPPGRPVGRTRPWRGSVSGEPGVIPDDPSMN